MKWSNEGRMLTNNGPQTKLRYDTRDDKLITYQAFIKKLVEFLDDVSFHHVPREEN